MTMEIINICFFIINYYNISILKIYKSYSICFPVQCGDKWGLESPLTSRTLRKMAKFNKEKSYEMALNERHFILLWLV